MCAMDRLIRLTGELDRYHGFGKAGRFASRGRLAAAAASRAAARIGGAEIRPRPKRRRKFSLATKH